MGAEQRSSVAQLLERDIRMASILGRPSLPVEEAVCSTSSCQGCSIHESGGQRPFLSGSPDLRRSRRNGRNGHRRHLLVARADARREDFQRGGLDFRRAAKMRLNQLLNRVQGCVTQSSACLAPCI